MKQIFLLFLTKYVYIFLTHVFDELKIDYIVIYFILFFLLFFVFLFHVLFPLSLALIISIFYCLNYTLVLLHLITTHLVSYLSLSSIVFIISMLFVGIFYCHNDTSLLLYLFITHFVIGAFECMFLSCHVRVSEWIYTL